MPKDKGPRLTIVPAPSPTEWAVERKRIRDELKSSELRYRRLFETAKDGILLLEGDTGRILDVNPYLECMLGYSHQDLVGTALWEIAPVKDVAASQDAVRRLQSEEYVRYDSLSLETRWRERIQVELVSNAYVVAGSRVIQCHVRDITSRRRAEEAAMKRNDELRALVVEMEQRDREMNALSRVNELLHACSSEDETYEVAARQARDLFAGQGGFLAMFGPEDRRLQVVAQWGDDAAIERTFEVHDCWAMRIGQPHTVTDPRDGVICRHFRRPPRTGFLCVPLRVQDGVLGLLSLVGMPSDPSRMSVTRQLAMAMGEAVKLSVSNLRLREKLREHATHDVVTGLHNRRYLDENLERELHRAKRCESPLCVTMLDIDHFKQFNDRFGHEAGDVLLYGLGQLLRDNVRKSDLACRYGGEEFVLVFPDSALAYTSRRIEQIRRRVKRLELRNGDQVLSGITMSAGIAQACGGEGTPRGLLRAADEALYAAKRAGRDRVIEHPPAA